MNNFMRVAIVKTAGDIIVMSRVLEIFGCWNIGRVMRENRMQFEYFFFVIFHPNLTFNMPEKLEEIKKNHNRSKVQLAYF